LRAALLLVVLTACRSAPTAAVADPTPAPSVSASVVKPVPAVATVATNRIEIPRKGHGAVVLELPVVKGIPAAERANAHLTAEKILGQSLDDVRNDAKLANASQMPSGVQGSTFKVPYHAHELLEIEAAVEFMGAYPSTQRFHVLIDLRTGNAIGAEAFVAARVPALVKRLEAMRAAEAKAAMKTEPALKDLVAGAQFEAKDLADFSPRPEGITFNFEYGFPHVAVAIQPPGRYSLLWSEVSPDVDPSGPLARAKP
jgi:hypothetical protein